MDHTEYGGSHLAVDIRIPIGTPVYAVANGVVEKAVSQITGFGRYIVVNIPMRPSLMAEPRHFFWIRPSFKSFGRRRRYDQERRSHWLLWQYRNRHHSSSSLSNRSKFRSYHPWWYLQLHKQATQNLNFFEAIDAGIGQEEAIENTINPMPWVQEYLNFSGDALSDGSSTDSENSGEKRNRGKNRRKSKYLFRTSRRNRYLSRYCSRRTETGFRRI